MAEELPMPEFENPPVSEVVLGVQFLPLAGWNVWHYGLLLNEVRADYPNPELHPPLGAQLELFGDDAWRAQTVMELTDLGEVRCWYVSKDGNRLIQVQRDRFVVNWRKRREEDVYPRYVPEIRPRFQREWDRFREFLRRSNIAAPEVRQCEVTYVNDIPRGDAWETFADTRGLLAPLAAGNPGKFLPDPETLRINFTYLMPDNLGRLHVATQRVRRNRDNQEVLQLRITARGAPRGEDVIEWLDIGRNWVVRGFDDLITPEAVRLWGRRE